MLEDAYFWGGVVTAAAICVVALWGLNRLIDNINGGHAEDQNADDR